MWNYSLIILFYGLLFSSPLTASSFDTREDGFLYLHADSLDNDLGVLELSENWKFHPGDDTLWADPDLDDSEWKIVSIIEERGLIAVEELLHEEVEGLAGKRHKRKEKGNHRGYRWGSNPGSVFLGESKVGIQIPSSRNQSHQIKVL